MGVSTTQKNTETNPSKFPLIEWFIEVLLVLLFCGVVIRMCLIPWPPTYTLTNYANSSIIQEGGNHKISAQNRAEYKPNHHNTTMIISLLVTNSNKAKDIMYGDTKINVYKNDNYSSIGETTLLGGFVQYGKSNASFIILVNVNQQKMKLEDEHKSGMLKVSLETKVRYIVLGWTTKQHLLEYEGFVPFNKSGMLLLGDDGVILEQVKHNKVY